jgi:hypothetical protein
MDALCAIQVGGCLSPSADIQALSVVLERHSSTITEFDAQLPAEMLEEVSSALACCTRLETLTGAYAHDPFIWLGLSDLHTLRGVDLNNVSVGIIAAALPKLHTLEAFGSCFTQATDFFTDLLPRLRVFHFEGRWPKAQEQADSTVAPLPLLQELVWDVSSDVAPRAFFGAQPTLLHARYAFISTCWLGRASESAPFLARVSDLRITTACDVDPIDPTDVARVLRAAPQLKKIHTDQCVQGGASWLAPTAPTHPAFEGLVHPRLRQFGTVLPESEAAPEAIPPDADWVAHLRRRHFPRLRELIVGDEAYFVTQSAQMTQECRVPP